jgi:hypothetical protein
VTAMGRGDATHHGELDEVRVGQKGPRGAVLRSGHGEVHFGACRDLDSGVPGPKERAGLGSFGC